MRPIQTTARSTRVSAIVAAFAIFTIFAIFAIFISPFSPALTAQTNDLIQKFEFAESRIDNSEETRMFPAKVPVPGVLWGTNPGYREGMVQLKVSCGANDSRVAENARGEEQENYVALFRVELFRYTNGDWQYVDWYRLPGTPPASACKALKTAAGLASQGRPLTVRLKIRARGTQHRNEVEDWSFENAE